MATADSVKAKIQGLINSSNATTGQNDTDLTSAVNHLKEGYGQGGGGDSYYDTFWDTYQSNGERQNYQLGFSGFGWNGITFKPKYPMSVNYAFEMFRACGEIDVAANSNIDFSPCTSFSNFAYSSGVTRFGVIDTTSSNALSYSFYRCEKLIEIEKLILKDDGSQNLGGNQTFEGCSALTDIVIDGTIGNDISFKDCKILSKASIESILNARKKFDEVQGETYTITLSKTAVEAAFPGVSDNDNDEWYELCYMAENSTRWTINLA